MLTFLLSALSLMCVQPVVDLGLLGKPLLLGDQGAGKRGVRC